MHRIRIAEAAGEDLESIWEYIAQDNPKAARKLMKEMNGKFQLLRDHPQLGRERETLFGRLRSFPVKNYVILYRPFDGGVEILRVLHGARDLGRILGRLILSL